MTAVEWLEEKFDKLKFLDFEQAKEIEKQQGYSEEEVLDLLKALQIHYLIYNERINIDKWFEQFKKK